MSASILFPKQRLALYGVLAFSRAGKVVPPATTSRTRKTIKKRSVFKLFQKNGAGARVLRFTFSFLTNASANLLVFLAKFGVTPQLGLQRHLASKGAPKDSQGVPKVSKRTAKSLENKQKS